MATYQQCILCQTLRFLKGNQDTSRAPNHNKQPCSCQTSLKNLLFHLVQRISLHFKSTDLYLFCTTKVFLKFLLPFQSQASFQSEQFGSYDYAARSLSLVASSLASQRSRMLMQKRPLLSLIPCLLRSNYKQTSGLHFYDLNDKCICPRITTCINE